MKLTRTIVIAICAGALALWLGHGVVCSLVRATSCGGNTPALGSCSEFAKMLRVRVEAVGAARTTIGAAWAGADDDAVRQCFGSRSRPSGFLLRRPSDEVSLETPELVVVNTRAYSNVPERSCWLPVPVPPTHAAGYSDGSVGLLLVEEFAALNTASFIPLEDWIDVRRAQ